MSDGRGGNGGKDRKSVELDGHEVELSNLDKVFFPDEGITKGDVIDYYREVAEVMLPHLRDRPISMQRYPEGLREEGFYQKEIGGHFPDWIERVTLEKEAGGKTTYVLCQDAASLVYLANQAVVTPHVWLSRADRPRRPDRLIFDLDPPESGEGGFDLVKAGARAIRDLLEELDLVPFVMTTGSRGLHVTVPLERRQEFDAARDFARKVSELTAHRDPNRFTVAQRKDKRAGRLFLDYLRNGYAQTGVAPYAVRGRAGAPVATPLEWDELSDAELGPRSYTIGNLLRRLGQRDDPWKRISDAAKPLGGPRGKLAELREDELSEEGEGQNGA